MGQIDHPVARQTLLSDGQLLEEPAHVHEPDTLDPEDQDASRAARGVVNGVLLGAVLWAVILWAIL